MAGFYDGELTSTMLLEDGDGIQDDGSRPLHGGFSNLQPPPAISMAPYFNAESEDRIHPTASPGGSSSGSQRRNARDGESTRLPTRTPTRTPSPTFYPSWEAPKKVELPKDQPDSLSLPQTSLAEAASSLGEAGTDGGSEALRGFGQMPPMLNPGFNPFLAAAAAGYNPQANPLALQYAMMLNSPAFLAGAQAQAAADAAAASGSLSGGLGAGGLPGGLSSVASLSNSISSGAGGVPGLGGSEAGSKPTGPQGSPEQYLQMMMAMQAMQQASGGLGKGAAHPSSNSAALPSGSPADDLVGSFSGLGSSSLSSSAAGPPGDGKRNKARGGAKEPGGGAKGSPLVEASLPKDRGGKGDRRRRGKDGPDEMALEQVPTRGKAKAFGGEARPSNNPIIEQLRSKDRHIELSDLTAHIAEIAQDQYGSRMIQQKLEIANDEEKQKAFKAILQKMPELTVDVFGNYVIQKFFEYGNAEQRRILAEQLVGQVLKMSHQMYGCRVVQKALDSVPIEQQVLLIGELKGNVIKCIEDQHGNHVIQKCIERLPTDKINFIVDSFDGQTVRMAKHCYGCRVIQRLIEYCNSGQISKLLDEVLVNLTELATDQYGNYVVQHVMEHSSRPGDRQNVLFAVRKNITLLSCHKFASNVVEKALACGTYEERAQIVECIVGGPADTHPPLLSMMRDRFGNYTVQRMLALAQSPQREMLIYRLNQEMPNLKKCNTYGKHIISALDKSQGRGGD